MYEVFDTFLKPDSWHTREAPDRDRFYCALRAVASNPQFRPEDMGDYFDRSSARSKVNADKYQEARRYYVAAAWAVKRFLEAEC